MYVIVYIPSNIMFLHTQWEMFHFCCYMLLTLSLKHTCMQAQLLNLKENLVILSYIHRCKENNAIR